jgi:hypothetical protein
MKRNEVSDSKGELPVEVHLGFGQKKVALPHVIHELPGRFDALLARAAKMRAVSKHIRELVQRIQSNCDVNLSTEAHRISVAAASIKAVPKLIKSGLGEPDERGRNKRV